MILFFRKVLNMVNQRLLHRLRQFWSTIESGPTRVWDPLFVGCNQIWDTAGLVPILNFYAKGALKSFFPISRQSHSLPPIHDFLVSEFADKSLGKECAINIGEPIAVITV
jgi:hypothetical protein